MTTPPASPPTLLPTLKVPRGGLASMQEAARFSTGTDRSQPVKRALAPIYSTGSTTTPDGGSTSSPHFFPPPLKRTKALPRTLPPACKPKWKKKSESSKKRCASPLSCPSPLLPASPTYSVGTDVDIDLSLPTADLDMPEAPIVVDTPRPTVATLIAAPTVTADVTDSITIHSCNGQCSNPRCIFFSGSPEL